MINSAIQDPEWYPLNIEGWKMVRVKTAIESFDSGVWGEDPYDDDSSTPVIRSNELDEGGNWRVTTPALRLLSSSEKEKARLREGDLLIVKSSGSHMHIGKTAVVTKAIEDLGSCYSNFTGRIRVLPYRTNSRFLWYFLNNSPGRDQLFYYGTTTTGLINLSATSIGVGVFALPPLPEQQRIAAYLDASCAAIDTAVAAKRRQLETLDALCSSILLNALTIGLQQKVETRPTGAAVLPQIPINWHFGRLKSVATIRYGLGQPPAELATGVAMIRATDVDAGTIRINNLLRVDPEELPHDRNPYLKAGEIIVVRSGAYTGDSAIIPPTLEGAVAGYDMVVTVPRASARFVAYCLLSRYVLEGQLLHLTLRAAQPHLNAEELGSVLLALPPTRKEQEAIADHLDTKLTEVKCIVNGIESQIATLSAYRKSLIHEYVTGQRRVTDEDVRRTKNSEK